MKKEDLVALGLDETQVNEVFKMRGLEIEASKEVVARLEADKQAAEEAKADLEAKITELEENSITAEDLESVKAEKTALETELAELTGKHEQKLNEVIYNHKLEDVLKSSGARDLKLVKTVLNQEELKFEDGNIIGLDEQLAQVKENYDFLFANESSPNVAFKKRGSSSSSLTKEDFSKMSYSEKTKLHNENPGLYKSLTQ